MQSNAGTEYKDSPTLSLNMSLKIDIKRGKDDTDVF